MAILLGIDLGTSSVKTMLAHSNGSIVGVEKADYDVMIPQVGYAEQCAEGWWMSLIDALKRLREKHPEEYSEIECIGFSGQMHGLVVIDDKQQEIRPSIIWLDQRSKKQVSEIEMQLGLDFVKEVLHNRASTGFALPSLLWLQEHEPENFSRVHSVISPKDYIRMKMIGRVACEYSDASATLMLDVKNRKWAQELLEKLNLPTHIFPELYSSTEIAGGITAECAELTGLLEGTPVVYGCGDQMAQSLGNGNISEGSVTSNIGTGGQISAYSNEDKYDPELRLNSFCHAVNNAYTIFGATLCAGMSLAWLKNEILKIDDYDTVFELAKEVEPGSGGLIFLPYLAGERTPHMDADAKGLFFGLALGQDRGNLIRAVLEGVLFSLKDSMELLEGLGIPCDTVIASGGGAQNPVWLQMQADIFDKEITVSNVQEQACLGACILAGIGAGIFDDCTHACTEMVSFSTVVYRPQRDVVDKYNEAYSTYKELYMQTSHLMKAK